MKTIEGDQELSEEAKKNWSRLFIHKAPDLKKFLKNNTLELERISKEHKSEAKVKDSLEKGLGADNNLKHNTA